MSLVIVVSDLLDLRAQKQKELAFYASQLENLKTKLHFIQREIDLTYHIVDLIRREKILDLRAVARSSISLVPSCSQP